MKALAHLTILDLTRLLPGAAATQMLASYGARVIKIEQPGLGDYARHGFGSQGVNPLFLETNRNKESIVLDLKQPEGKATLRELSTRADMLIESFRPGVMDRLDLGYATLSQLNPRLIYVATAKPANIRRWPATTSTTSPWPESSTKSDPPIAPQWRTSNSPTSPAALCNSSSEPSPLSNPAIKPASANSWTYQ
jgi:hypothetical protein